MPDLNVEKITSGFNGSPMKQYLDSKSVAGDQLGVVLIPNVGSGKEFCFHDVLKKSKPSEIDGVVYPTNFRCLRSLTPKEFGDVQEIFFELVTNEGVLSEDEIDFINLFYPIFIPQRGVTDLELTVAQVGKLSGDIVGMSIEPFITNDGNKPPISYLPTKFTSELDKLEISDILHIFPPIEQKLLALSIGRAMVGADGTVHTQSGEKISHAFRTFCLIYGFSAGTGKSTLFRYLWDAIESTGYSVSHFNSLDDHFGLGEVCTTNIAYADDLLTETLTKLLKAPLFKQMITGEKIRAHIKYAPDVEVKSQAVFFACVNDFSPNALYGLDNGTLNRLAILSTYTSYEIGKLVGTGLSAGSPCLKTREHIDWLTETLGVDRKAIMLKFASECAKFFMTEIRNGTLEATTNNLKRKLRTQIHEGIEFSTIQLFQFCYMVRTGSIPPQLANGQLVGDSFFHLNFILNDAEAHPIRELIKKDWNDLGRPSQHIWNALKLIDNVSVNNCVQNNTDSLKSTLSDSVKAIKAYWLDFRLASGFNMASNVAMIKQDWAVSRSSISAITELVSKAREVATPRTLDSKVGAKADHLSEIEYDRQKWAESLNK